jgi:hypothetical protein
MVCPPQQRDIIIMDMDIIHQITVMNLAAIIMIMVLVITGIETIVETL